MDYGLDGRGSIPGRGKVVSFLYIIQLIIGAPSLGVKWRRREADHHLHPVQRSRKLELHLHCPACLHIVVRNHLARRQLYTVFILPVDSVASDVPMTELRMVLAVLLSSLHVTETREKRQDEAFTRT
jgi:hypothetical protein